MADRTGKTKRPYCVEDSQLPAPKKPLRKEEWYYPPSGTYGPKKYYLCEYCKYKSLSSTHFKTHVENIHRITEMKSHTTRSTSFKTASLSKRKKYSNGRKREVVRRARQIIPVDHKLPEIPLEELSVCPESITESTIQEESDSEASKNSVTNPEEVIGQETSIYFCSKCSYWNRWVTGFHDHMLGHHTSDASYRCSSCDYANRFRTKVNFHIRRAKKMKEKSHSDANTVMIHPVPADKYADYRRTTVIKKGLNYGWMTEATSECKDVDDFTDDLDEDHDLESAPPIESLEAEELELRKEIVRARNALFENPSIPPEKKEKCTANLDKLRLRMDSMKMKVKSTEQEIESLSSLKLYTEKKMKEVTGAKMKSEYELRSFQCEVLSLQLTVEETMDLVEVEKKLADAEEKVECAEKDLERKVADLESFQKGYESLIERSEQAEEALAGASQVLLALEGELKVVEESENENAKVHTTQERIKDCMMLEKRLLKITYLKSLTKLCQQEKLWLDSIKSYEQEETKLN